MSWIAKRGKVALVVMILNVVGCHLDMHDQPKLEPLEGSKHFQDGLASRPLVSGTVPHQKGPRDELLLTGSIDGRLANVFPFEVSRDIVVRGQQRYDIFCSPCHGRTGDGRGMIVQRGFPAPPSFHTDSLREKPVGHYYSVITQGFGRMYSYASRIKPEDRWAIVSYVRALQLSQNATISDVPEEQRRNLSTK